MFKKLFKEINIIKSQNLIVYFNISMMFNELLIRWFWVDVTTKPPLKSSTTQEKKKNYLNWIDGYY